MYENVKPICDFLAYLALYLLGHKSYYVVTIMYHVYFVIDITLMVQICSNLVGMDVYEGLINEFIKVFVPI